MPTRPYLRISDLAPATNSAPRRGYPQRPALARAAACHVLVLAVCACALLACKSGEKTRQSFARELAGQLDSSCTSEAGDKDYAMLFVFCQKGNRADELATAAQKTVARQCSKLAELGFTKAQVAGATTAATAEVKGATCTFKPNPTM